MNIGQEYSNFYRHDLEAQNKHIGIFHKQYHIGLRFTIGFGAMSFYPYFGFPEMTKKKCS